MLVYFLNSINFFGSSIKNKTLCILILKKKPTLSCYFLVKIEKAKYDEKNENK